MSTTFDFSTVPEDLLLDMLRSVEDNSLLTPLFKEVTADFSALAREFGFQPNDDLLDVGSRREGNSVMFRWTLTMQEVEPGRHFSVWLNMQTLLKPPYFGGFALSLQVFESGYDEPEGLYTLTYTDKPWEADVGLGWTQAHCQSLAAHYLASWQALRHISVIPNLRKALERLEEALAP